MRFEKILLSVMTVAAMLFGCAACAAGRPETADSAAGEADLKKKVAPSESPAEALISKSIRPEIKEIYLAGGCFWGLEGYFQRVKGIVDTEVGYANGKSAEADYYHLNETGHAETLKITYDSHRIHLAEILDRYMRVIDPFSLNQQGNDRGTQYRTGIYYTDPADASIAKEFIQIVEAEHPGRKSAVELQPLANFVDAERYHQDYLIKNPSGYCHINLAEAEEILYPAIQKPSKEELQKVLSSLAFDVTQNAATERPGTSEYLDFSKPGIYVDVVSGQPLFSTDDQFDSGCGWPSFTMPITTDVIDYSNDGSYGMQRIEVRSDGADSHLGHVFDDGPRKEGGLRFCINGAALRFVPLEKMAEEGYARLLPYVQKR